MKVLKIITGFLMIMLQASCQISLTNKLPEELNKKCPQITIKKGKALPQIVNLTVAYSHCRANNNSLIELLGPN